jgi:hypothetical protein
MKKTYLVLLICFLSFQNFVSAQTTLTDNDINFKKASYNSSMIVADSNNLVLNLSTSLSNNLQETSRMHFLAYGNLEKLGLGVGVKINSRFRDFYKTTSAELLIAKKLVFRERNDLNFGLNFGIDYMGINDNYFNSFVDQSDLFIVNNPNQNIRFLAGFGASYIWNNKFQVGFSMPELIKTENTFYPTMFSNALYKQALGKAQDLYIQPEVLLYSTNITPATFEGSTSFGYKDYAWLKLGGRSTKTLVVGLGGGYDFIQVGYNYNMNFGNYEVVNQTQHNINVCFNFLQSKKSDQDPTDLAGDSRADSLNFPYYISKVRVESEVTATYYIAVESFKIENDALARANDLLMSGQMSFIVREINSGIFNVCVAYDDDFERIVSKALLIKNSIAPDAWIIENK